MMAEKSTWEGTRPADEMDPRDPAQGSVSQVPSWHFSCVTGYSSLYLPFDPWVPDFLDAVLFTSSIYLFAPFHPGLDLDGASSLDGY